MPLIHKDLANGHWEKFSILDQLGNIGSEVGRSFLAKSAGDAERMNGAIDRALELFDLTIRDPKNAKRLKEILRAREVFCGFFFDGPVYGYTPEDFERYFMMFALAARSQHSARLARTTCRKNIGSSKSHPS